MSHWTLRILALFGAGFGVFRRGAEAGAGDGSRGARFPRSDVCRPCKKLNTVPSAAIATTTTAGTAAAGIGAAMSGTTVLVGSAPSTSTGFSGPAIRRHHRHGVGVLHPAAPDPFTDGFEPSRRLGAGAASPSAGLHRGAPALGGGLGFRRFGPSGVHASPSFRPGAATVSPGLTAAGRTASAAAATSMAAGSEFLTSARRLARLCRRRQPFPWRRDRSSPHWRAGLARFYWRRVSCRRRDWNPSTSARPSRPALLAAVSMPVAGSELLTSARRPRPALRASGFHASAGSEVSMPAAGSEPPTSARPPRPALPAAGFMAVAGLEGSRAARSDRAAWDIAERPLARSASTSKAVPTPS